MSTKPRDMTGTAYCMDCGVSAVHERGPGTPLVIRHDAVCPNVKYRHECSGHCCDECHCVQP